MRRICSRGESGKYLRVDGLNGLLTKLCHLGTNLTQWEEHSHGKPDSCRLAIGERAATVDLQICVRVKNTDLHCFCWLIGRGDGKSILVLLGNSIGVHEDGGGSTEGDDEVVDRPGEPIIDVGNRGFDSSDPKSRVTLEKHRGTVVFDIRRDWW